MSLRESIEIVLILARSNIVSDGDAKINGMESWRQECDDACNIVENFFNEAVFKEHKTDEWDPWT